MPRVNLYIQDLDEIEALDEQDDWDAMLGLRAGHAARDAQHQTVEMRDRRRLARGSREALDRRRSERRKHVYRGGKR